MTTPPYPDTPPGQPYGQQYPPPHGGQPGFPPPPPPPPPRKRNPLVLLAAAIGGVVLLGAAAFGIKSLASRGGTGSSASAAGSCTEVSADMVTPETQSPDEPVVRMPKPAGWERSTKLDSNVVRVVLRAASLEKKGTAPTAVLTMEEPVGTGPADAAFQRSVDVLTKQLGATVTSDESTTVCGLPARDIRYTAAFGGGPVHPVRALIVADKDDPTYLLTLTVQSMEPDNATYRADADTIVKGLQVLPAGSR